MVEDVPVHHLQPAGGEIGVVGRGVVVGRVIVVKPEHMAEFVGQCMAIEATRFGIDEVDGHEEIQIQGRGNRAWGFHRPIGIGPEEAGGVVKGQFPRFVVGAGINADDPIDVAVGIGVEGFGRVVLFVFGEGGVDQGRAEVARGIDCITAICRLRGHARIVNGGELEMDVKLAIARFVII